MPNTGIASPAGDQTFCAAFPNLDEAATKAHETLNTDDDEEQHYIESDDEDDTYRLEQNPERIKRVSEKKRIEAAILQNWLDTDQRSISQKFQAAQDPDFMSVSQLVKYGRQEKIISSPREYQIDLFERAKKENTIVVLDTGSGKTLIAALLIRHIVGQEMEDRAKGAAKRVAFFLVEKVYLCLQQYDVLEANLDFPMTKIFGNMAEISSNNSFFSHNLDTKMVIVCTAQILLDCLNNGFVSMDQINLLIFDEAHHTKKNHPYSRIMRSHYMQMKGKRPRILGMTASPVDAQTRDVKAASLELESALCSKIATVSDEVLLESQIRKQQSEIKESYARLQPPEEARTQLWSQIFQQVSHNPQFRAQLDFTQDAASSLGRWCADRFWQLLITDDEISRLSAKTDRDFAGNFGSFQNEQATNAVQEVLRVVEGHTFKPVSIDIHDLSTKVLTLYNLLKQAFMIEGTKRCIVFVDKRWTVCILADLFQQHAMRISGMKVSYIVGSQSSISNLGNMTLRDQILTMRKFKEGNTNCLFATNVAEEGIDVPECDLVIRFDLYTSVIQYLQSKGRARQMQSKFINMIEEGNVRQLRNLHQAIRDSTALRRFCSALPENRKVQDFVVDAELVAQCEQLSQQIYVVPSTGARLSYAHSLEVLGKFASSLTPPGESCARAEYVVTTIGKDFVADVILPQGSPVKCISGFRQRSKMLAKCSAAFQACVTLVKKKYIDDHLQPAFAKRVPAMRNARLALSSNKKDEYSMRIRPNVWRSLGESTPTELFATVIRLENPSADGCGTRPLMLITRKRLPNLPDIPLFFGNGHASLARLESSVAPFHITPEEFEALAAFTKRVFADCFSKEFDAEGEELPYFLGPGVNDHVEKTDTYTQVDWALVQLVHKNESLDWENAPDEFFENKFVTDPFDGSRKLILHGLNRSLKPSDPTPADAAEPKCRAYRLVEQNIKEYSNSLWLKARKRSEWRDDQPVVNAELLSLRRNLLDEFQVDEQVNTKCYIILESLNVSPLPVDLVTMAMTFPAIIHRIDSALIALDACTLLDLEIPPHLAVEAMTKDSDNTGDHDEEQANFQAGMGNNYERLEFLGDTFLKMAVTIGVFTNIPTADECQYHVERMLLICNQNLFNHAVDRGLHEYIRSKSFQRRTWYPDLKLKKGKAAKAEMHHILANKTIADVCEAVIGAAYLSGEKGNLDMAVKAVTKMVKGKNHKMQSFSDYYAAYKVPLWQVARSSQQQRTLVGMVANEISYEFQFPHILSSAFKHPSYTYGNFPDYQSLEFLGDALLDMAIVDYLFKRFPEADPQWLTEHKMAMVSNQFLGCICVKLDLHKHILLTTASLQGQIRHYINEIKQAEAVAQEEAKEKGMAFRCDFWLNASQPPKVLADMIEALVGAMFVDSQYNLSVVQTFFDRFIQPYFEDMTLYDTFAARHPVTSLSRMLHEEVFCIHWSILTKEVPCPPDEGVKALTDSKVLCALLVHNKVFINATAESGRYAKIAVAKKALKTFEEIGAEAWRREVGCDCKAGLDTIESAKALESHATAI